MVLLSSSLSSFFQAGIFGARKVPYIGSVAVLRHKTDISEFFFFDSQDHLWY